MCTEGKNVGKLLDGMCVCVYTASISQVLYDPRDYSEGGSSKTTNTQTHTEHRHLSIPYPQKKRKECGRKVEGDNRSEGGRKERGVQMQR